MTLTGWVDSYIKRWAAEDAAHRVRGVKAVANEIAVRLPSSAERTDADIAAAAVRALEWDALVPVEYLDVTIWKGWVTLTGTVEWQYQKNDAERVVRERDATKNGTVVEALFPGVDCAAGLDVTAIGEALTSTASGRSEGMSGRRPDEA